MISKMSEINSSGDVLDFVMDNIESLTAIEKYIALIEGESDEPFKDAARFLKDFIEEYLDE